MSSKFTKHEKQLVLALELAIGRLLYLSFSETFASIQSDYTS